MRDVLQHQLLSPSSVVKAWPWELKSLLQVILMQLVQTQSRSEQESSGESDRELGGCRFWVNRSGVEPEVLPF